MAERPRVLPDDEAVVRALGMPAAIGLDSHREALRDRGRRARPELDAGRARGRAEVLVPADPRRLDIRAEGPGLLVVSEGWDPGWSAAVDDAPAPIVRVNHARDGGRAGPRASIAWS